MLRPVAALAVIAVVGLVAVRVAFGVTAGILGFLVGLAIKLAIVCGLIYLGIRIVSPDTARKMKEHFVGPAT